MTTIEKLTEIGAKDIKLEFFNEKLIGRISFNVNGVEFSGQFDIDNTGLYAIELVSELSELNKLNKK